MDQLTRCAQRIGVWSGLLAILGGCQATVMRPPKGLRVTSPVVLVEPIAVDPANTLPHVATAEELTDLLIHSLHARDIHAVGVAEQGALPSLVLGCRVPQMTYATVRRFPRRFDYQVALDCTLRDAAAQTVRWQRALTQRYDETTLLNTMTQLPPHHERIVYRHCVVPLWNAMAYGVQLFLERPPLPSSVPTEPALIKPQTAPYSK